MPKLSSETLIARCIARAASDYERFHMFVECNGPEEWREHCHHYETGEPLTLAECFSAMDRTANHWADIEGERF